MRYANNPILTPRDLAPSQESMKIECLLNPGVFRFDGKTWLLIRVAERPEQREGEISFPLLDDANRITVMRVPSSSPELDLSDPRVISYKGSDYLTTMSHLRLMSSRTASVLSKSRATGRSSAATPTSPTASRTAASRCSKGRIT